jgi:hypothetical protein
LIFNQNHWNICLILFPKNGNVHKLLTPVKKFAGLAKDEIQSRSCGDRGNCIAAGWFRYFENSITVSWTLSAYPVSRPVPPRTNTEDTSANII